MLPVSEFSVLNYLCILGYSAMPRHGQSPGQSPPCISAMPSFGLLFPLCPLTHPYQPLL